MVLKCVSSWVAWIIIEFNVCGMFEKSEWETEVDDKCLSTGTVEMIFDPHTKGSI